VTATDLAGAPARVAARAAETPARRIALLLLPNFSLAAFAGALEPLQLANRQAGRPLYRPTVLSPDGATATASDGARVRVEAGLAAGAFERIVVCGGFAATQFDDPATFAWLRRHARAGTPVGALSDGALVLARAGLLQGYRATVHWHCQDSAAEAFPELAIGEALFVLDGPRFSCAGGTAALDMTLTQIAREHSRGFAERLARALSHNRIRGAEDAQRMATPARIAGPNPPLVRALDLIEARFDAALSGAEIAAHAGVSARQLQRLFRRRLGCTPQQHLQATRLLRAREMLVYTELPILQVALACGFASHTHFARAYRRRYGHPPTAARGRSANAGPSAAGRHP